MAIGDIYELTHTAQLFGKPIQNVFHIRAEDSSTSADDLASEWSTEVLPSIGDLQTQEVTDDKVRVIKLFDFTDFWTGPVASPARGSQNDTLPRFVAVNYTLNTNVRNIGPGSKRFAGISAGWQDDNRIDSATYIPLLEALRLVLPAPFGTTPADAYRMVIVKRVFYEATLTSKAGYYMPREEADLEWAYVTSAAVNLELSHQVSRD